MSEAYETALISTNPGAVEATRSTIAMLGGELIERDGKFYVTGSHYVRWAAVRQGYVLSISDTPTDIS